MWKKLLDLQRLRGGTHDQVVARSVASLQAEADSRRQEAEADGNWEQ